ncbi:MAG: hypothetical protein GKS00_07950 [Alphaproteobacteria bacterium]|nr:hypothetical protein [Alphaproteobacteria bacterium]
MRAYHAVIREAYRAALADWAASELDGHDKDGSLICHTASLASIWANDSISEKNVIDVLKSVH